MPLPDLRSAGTETQAPTSSTWGGSWAITCRARRPRLRAHGGRVARPVVTGQTCRTQRRPVERGHAYREVVDLDLEPQPRDSTAMGGQQHPGPTGVIHHLGLELVDESGCDETVDEVGRRGPGQAEGGGDTGSGQGGAGLDDGAQHERQVVGTQRLLPRGSSRGQALTTL